MADRDLAARQALADVVVGLALQLEVHAPGEEGAEALPGAAREPEPHPSLGQAGVAEAARDLAGDATAHREVMVADRVVAGERQSALEVRRQFLDDLAVERDQSRPVVARLRVLPRYRGAALGRREQHREVEQLCARDIGVIHPHQQVVPADHLVEGARAQGREDLPHLLSDEREVGDDLLRRPLELGAQVLALGGDAGGTGVQVALPGHGAPERHEGCRAETVGLRAQQRGDDHVAASLEPAVGPHLDAVPEAVPHERGLGLREAEFPRRAGVLDGRERRRAGASVVAGDEHVVGVGLANPGGHGADARLGDELHADAWRAGSPS